MKQKSTRKQPNQPIEPIVPDVAEWPQIVEENGDIRVLFRDYTPLYAVYYEVKEKEFSAWFKECSPALALKYRAQLLDEFDGMLSGLFDEEPFDKYSGYEALLDDYVRLGTKKPKIAELWLELHQHLMEEEVALYRHGDDYFEEAEGLLKRHLNEVMKNKSFAPAKKKPDLL